MSKHTPGPWKWDGNVYKYDPEEEAPWLIAENTEVLEGEIHCKSEADARLIEASPDLLAACEAFCSQIEWKPSWDDEGWERCHELARAAIAKVRS